MNSTDANIQEILSLNREAIEFIEKQPLELTIDNIMEDDCEEVFNFYKNVNFLDYADNKRRVRGIQTVM